MAVTASAIERVAFAATSAAYPRKVKPAAANGGVEEIADDAAVGTGDDDDDGEDHEQIRRRSDALFG